MPPRSPDWPRPRAADASAISALAQAIDLARAPRLATHMRRRPLPRDVLTVIELASGRPETMAAAVASTARDRAFLLTTAELYLRQVVCFAGADPYRTLGVAAGAPRPMMRQHMRALVLWLHPDRNMAGRDPILMQRVLEAWRTVGGEESRAPVPSRLSPGVASRSRRTRNATYRPTWIAQPLPKPRRRARPPRHAAALRAALVVMAMVVPEHALMGPPSLADDSGKPVIVRAAASPSPAMPAQRSDPR